MLTIAANDGAASLMHILQRLEAAEVKIESLTMRRPTLDDVFLFLTENGNRQHAEERNHE